MKNTIVLLAMVLLCGGKVWSLDKAKLEDNLRKQFGISPKQVIEIKDAVDSDTASCTVMVPVTIDGQPYPIYMMRDETKYFWGQIFDLTKDPDVERWNKINLTNVHVKGSGTAPVTVVEYTDLECPYCAMAHKSIVTPLLKDYSPEKVRFVFKHYPLEMHPWAKDASVVAECAGVQKPEAFWDVVDQYYGHQQKINKKNFEKETKKIFKNLKLDADKLGDCRKGSASAQEIEKDIKEGTDVGVRGTPTFVVNGRMMNGRYEDLKLLIEEKSKAEDKTAK